MAETPGSWGEVQAGQSQQSTSPVKHFELKAEHFIIAVVVIVVVVGLQLVSNYFRAQAVHSTQQVIEQSINCQGKPEANLSFSYAPITVQATYPFQRETLLGFMTVRNQGSDALNDILIGGQNISLAPGQNITLNVTIEPTWPGRQTALGPQVSSSEFCTAYTAQPKPLNVTVDFSPAPDPQSLLPGNYSIIETINGDDASLKQLAQIYAAYGFENVFHPFTSQSVLRTLLNETYQTLFQYNESQAGIQNDTYIAYAQYPGNRSVTSVWSYALYGPIEYGNVTYIKSLLGGMAVLPQVSSTNKYLVYGNLRQNGTICGFQSRGWVEFIIYMNGNCTGIAGYDRNVSVRVNATVSELESEVPGGFVMASLATNRTSYEAKYIGQQALPFMSVVVISNSTLANATPTCQGGVVTNRGGKSYCTNTFPSKYAFGVMLQTTELSSNYNATVYKNAQYTVFDQANASMLDSTVADLQNLSMQSMQFTGQSASSCALNGLVKCTVVDFYNWDGSLGYDLYNNYSNTTDGLEPEIYVYSIACYENGTPKMQPVIQGEEPDGYAIGPHQYQIGASIAPLDVNCYNNGKLMENFSGTPKLHLILNYTNVLGTKITAKGWANLTWLSVE